ncbi:response regulator [Cesiribacter sp. SM1]|uniref:response regulator n=1 Tax=Cesiribacter sp. SM1 TaxID=2861196 RepID=UPI001CD78873|nr:response regulator [Cesiribacter sp. SM1]
MKSIHRVLVIDDDETSCIINKIFLKEMNITEEIECIEDANEALSLLIKVSEEGSFKEKGPDLIFLDINMPKMDGFEFLERVRELEGRGALCKQKIVMYTSSYHPRDIERAKQHGVLAYVIKPLTETKMKSILEAYNNNATRR